MDALRSLAADLSVPSVEGEPLDAFRERVLAAWRDPARVDAAVPDDRPRAPVLGEMRIGAAKMGGG